MTGDQPFIAVPFVSKSVACLSFTTVSEIERVEPGIEGRGAVNGDSA